jgi:hypothetical protein
MIVVRMCRSPQNINRMRTVDAASLLPRLRKPQGVHTLVDPSRLRFQRTDVRTGFGKRYNRAQPCFSTKFKHWRPPGRKNEGQKRYAETKPRAFDATAKRPELRFPVVHKLRQHTQHALTAEQMGICVKRSASIRWERLSPTLASSASALSTSLCVWELRLGLLASTNRQGRGDGHGSGSCNWHPINSLTGYLVAVPFAFAVAPMICTHGLVLRPSCRPIGRN